MTLDDATWAMIVECASNTFPGFDVARDSIITIRRTSVEIPYLRPPTPLDDEWLPKHKDFIFNVPANWFEQFKDDYWPRWLRRLWPIRTKQAVRSYPVFSPAFRSLSITTIPHQLSDGTVINMGFGAWPANDGTTRGVVAVKVAE